jgi:hypothetical protein
MVSTQAKSLAFVRQGRKRGADDNLRRLVEIEVMRLHRISIVTASEHRNLHMP